MSLETKFGTTPRTGTQITLKGRFAIRLISGVEQKGWIDIRWVYVLLYRGLDYCCFEAGDHPSPSPSTALNCITWHFLCFLLMESTRRTICVGQVTLLLIPQHHQDNERLIKIAVFLTRQSTHKNLLGEYPRSWCAVSICQGCLKSAHGSRYWNTNYSKPAKQFFQHWK